MAKKSKVAKSEQRKELVRRYAAQRAALKETIRGFLRKFGLSRIAFREKALAGQITGVIKDVELATPSQTGATPPSSRHV